MPNRLYDYENQILFFYEWMIGNLSKKDIKEFDDLYIPLSGKTFIEYCCDEQGFESQKEALFCGTFVKGYFETFNKLPEIIPNKHIWNFIFKNRKK